jgi:hypothetical protein
VGLLSYYCNRCKADKYEDAFPNAKKNWPYTWCKECLKVHYVSQKAVRSEKRIAKYYADAETAREASRQYYRDNKEKQLLTCKNWAAANRGLSNSYKTKTKAARKFRVPAWLTSSDIETIKGMYAMAQRVAKCLQVSFHVDHIVPLSGKNVSGLHVPWNMRVLPASTNLAKSNHLWIF